MFDELLGMEPPLPLPPLPFPTFTSTPTFAGTCSGNTLLSRERPAAIPHLVMISTLASSGSKLKAS